MNSFAPRWYWAFAPVILPARGEAIITSEATSGAYAPFLKFFTRTLYSPASSTARISSLAREYAGFSASTLEKEVSSPTFFCHTNWSAPKSSIMALAVNSAPSSPKKTTFALASSSKL